jgi:hypothetical protein
MQTLVPQQSAEATQFCPIVWHAHVPPAPHAMSPQHCELIVHGCPCSSQQSVAIPPSERQLRPVQHVAMVVQLFPAAVHVPTRHVPAVQTLPAGQTVVHVPQWFGSPRRLVQVIPHNVLPVAHPHVPAVQICVIGHT